MVTEQATEHATIAAPPDRCFEVALDFERYPEWAAGLREVTVLERDEHGRGSKVRYRAAAMGQSIRYTLEYDYSDAPRTLAWKQVDGDLTRRLDGEYVFDADPSGPDSTRMTYHLVVELKVPLLGFIKRRAEKIILHTALRELKARAESSVSR